MADYVDPAALSLAVDAAVRTLTGMNLSQLEQYQGTYRTAIISGHTWVWSAVGTPDGGLTTINAHPTLGGYWLMRASGTGGSGGEGSALTPVTRTITVGGIEHTITVWRGEYA